MSAVANLLARKQALMERLESGTGPNEREEIKRLLAQIETALNLLESGDAATPGVHRSLSFRSRCGPCRPREYPFETAARSSLASASRKSRAINNALTASRGSPPQASMAWSAVAPRSSGAGPACSEVAFIRLCSRSVPWSQEGPSEFPWRSGRSRMNLGDGRLAVGTGACRSS